MDLSLEVYPIESQSLEHTIKVYYKESLSNMLLSPDECTNKVTETMIECCNRTAVTFSHYNMKGK